MHILIIKIGAGTAPSNGAICEKFSKHHQKSTTLNAQFELYGTFWLGYFTFTLFGDI